MADEKSTVNAGGDRAAKTVTLDIPADFFNSAESRDYVNRQFQRAMARAFEEGRASAAEPSPPLTRLPVSYWGPKEGYIQYGKPCPTCGAVVGQWQDEMGR